MIYLQEGWGHWRTSCSTTPPATPGRRSGRWRRQDPVMLSQCWMTSQSFVRNIAGEFNELSERNLCFGVLLFSSSVILCLKLIFELRLTCKCFRNGHGGLGMGISSWLLSNLFFCLFSLTSLLLWNIFCIPFFPVAFIVRAGQTIPQVLLVLTAVPLMVEHLLVGCQLLLVLVVWLLREVHPGMPRPSLPLLAGKPELLHLVIPG